MKNEIGVTEFKKNSKQLFSRLENGLVTVTVRGKTSFVVQTLESYQKLLEDIERLHTLATLRKSLESLEKGQGRNAEKFFEEFFAKNNICKKEESA